MRLKIRLLPIAQKKRMRVFLQNVNSCWATSSHCELGTSCIDWFVSDQDRQCSDHQDKVYSPGYVQMSLNDLTYLKNTVKWCNHWPCHSMRTAHWQNHILWDLCPDISIKQRTKGLPHCWAPCTFFPGERWGIHHSWSPWPPAIRQSSEWLGEKNATGYWAIDIRQPKRGQPKQNMRDSSSKKKRNKKRLTFVTLSKWQIYLK